MSASPRVVPASNPHQMLAAVWQRNLPLMRQRLTQLSSTAAAAHDGDLPSAARHEAAGIAHKLAGSLGMFGYMRGSEIAQALEILLEHEGPVSATELQQLTHELAQVLPQL